ncbi:hypothetical protein PEC301877_05300 [Pectobacterium carotovorum subsp. carotovorum]|nr:hypothetical protein PEC301877_05300 [Pectobacterium carotovorum subsp. carotovorum]
MKKNKGWFYIFYKEWKGLLDFGIPILLGVIGLALGFFVKKIVLPIFEIDGNSAIILISSITAFPVGLYSRLTNHYAAKIQEDKDYDELTNKQNQINNQKKRISHITKKLQNNNSGSVGTYDNVRKLTVEIRNYLNTSGISRTHVIAICAMLDTGDDKLYNLTIKQQDFFTNTFDDDTDEENNELSINSPTESNASIQDI